MMQPNSTVAKRVMKRGVLAIDEPPQKRMRMNASSNSNSSNLTDILDRLQREMLDIGGIRGVAAAASRGDGPIIADITDEWVPTTSSSGSPQNQMQNKAKQCGSKGYNMSYTPPNAQVTSAPATNGSVGVGLATQQVQQTNDCNIVDTSTPVKTPATSLSPSITLSPSLERQFSQDFQEYLNGVDLGFEGCRDILGGHWDFNMFDTLDVDDEVEHQQNEKHQDVNKNSTATFGDYTDRMLIGGAQQPGVLTYPSPQLALEGGPLTAVDSPPSKLKEIESEVHPNVNPSLEFHCSPLIGSEDLMFPNTPELLTPCTSPRP